MFKMTGKGSLLVLALPHQRKVLCMFDIILTIEKLI